MSQDSEFNKMTAGGTGWYRIKGEEYLAWLRGSKKYEPTHINPYWNDVNFYNLIPILEMGDYEIAADLLEEAGIGCDEIINQLRGRHPCWICPESSGYTLSFGKWTQCLGCNGTKMIAVPMTPDSWVLETLRFKHWKAYLDEEDRRDEEERVREG